MNTNETKAKRSHKKGFTLGEVVTTVAIISVVTSIALPNYLRIRAETNKEMVRQHMRVIAEKMTEIMGRKSQYPDPGQWPFTGSFDPDEQVITANLDAIDDLCYTINQEDYITDQRRSQYVFRSCANTTRPECAVQAQIHPKCWVIHAHAQLSAYFSPGMVGELERWDGAGNTMLAPTMIDTCGGVCQGYMLARLLSDADTSEEDKVRYLTASLIGHAVYGYAQSLSAAQIGSDSMYASETTSLSIVYTMSAEALAQYEAVTPQLYEQLKSLGITMFQTIHDLPAENYDNSISSIEQNETYDHIPNPKYVQIGFTFTPPVDYDSTPHTNGWPDILAVRPDLAAILSSQPVLEDWAISEGICGDPQSCTDNNYVW